MKPLAYNFAGEVVFEDDAAQRFSGLKSAGLKAESDEHNLAKFLRIDLNAKESTWLCAFSFCSQPSNRIIQIDQFFKICTSHLAADQKKKILPQFAVESLHAFYRINQNLFDSRNATVESFSKLEELFENLGFAKIFERLPSLKESATPRMVLLARAGEAVGKTLDQKISPPYFNPYATSRQLENSLAEPDVPWSLNELSRIQPPPYTSFNIDNGDLPSIEDIANLMTIINKSHNSEISQTGRHPYPSISKLNPSTSTLTTSLLLAHKNATTNFAKFAPNIDKLISNALGTTEKNLATILSAEQIDACGFALKCFTERKSFILADETGLGKGRTLAALAKIFLNSGRPVLFITEKKHLFSDFWRDLCDIYESPPPPPFILHQKAKVLSSDATIVAKSATASKFKEIIASQKKESQLIFSTYSQFNRDHKVNAKQSYAESQLANGLIILDESHNAAGESQTRKSINALIDTASKCIFSSATYAKHEHAFELYGSATPLKKNEMALLLSSFSGGDPIAASNAIARGLVKIGSMTRREHQPESDANSTVITPANRDEFTTERSALHLSLNMLFELQELLDFEKQKRGEDTEHSWAILGGVLSRVSRQFNLLSKIPTAISLIEKLRSEGKKPVIALESTFETFAKAQIQWIKNPQVSPDSLDEEDPENSDDDVANASISKDALSFQNLFALVIESMASNETIRHLGNPPALIQKKSEAIKFATENLPAWLASPIDEIRHRLATINISCGEISGRSLEFNQSKNDDFIIANRNPDLREATVRAFNNGKIDAIILTQAGASGISLHSSPLFADTSQRAFIELEICLNPSQRTQFLGRVRRKGQINSPEYYVVSSGSPFEHRLIERATAKQLLLSGMTSASQQVAAGEIPLGKLILSRSGNEIAEEWLQFNPTLSKQLGIYTSNKSDDYAEKLLKRLPLLPPNQQDAIFDFLTTALSISHITPLIANPKAAMDSATLIRRRPVWGPQSHLETSQSPNEFEPTIYVNEWMTTFKPHNISQEVVNKLLTTKSLAIESQLKQLTETATKQLQKRSSSIAERQKINNLRAAAPFLAVGNEITISHPETKRKIVGIISKIAPPKNNSWLLHPCQWQISIIFPGQPFEINTSLSVFFKDKYAELKPTNSTKNWDSFPEKPYHFVTIDGHCGYSRWYAEQIEEINSVTFSTSSGAIEEQYNLSFDCCIEDAQTWPIPLVDPRLTLQLLQKETGLTLFGDRVFSKTSTQLSPCSGGWILAMPRTRHDEIIDYNLDRRLGPRKYAQENDIQMICRFVSIRDIHATITLLHGKGCIFFAPASKKKWHAQALDLLMASAKQAKVSKRR